MKKNDEICYKQLYFLSVLLVTVISSCTSVEEQDYKRKEWRHKARMLDLEYKEKCIELKNDIEMDQTLRWLDSVTIE